MGEKDFRVRKGLIVDGTGTSSIAGSLGIGTTSPDALLHVSSGTSGDAGIIIEADTDNNDEADLPFLWMKQDGDITAHAFQATSNKLQIINNISSSGGIQFLTGTTNNTGTTNPATSASVRLHIASAGDVGIGTTSPDSLLHVRGSDAILTVEDTSIGVEALSSSMAGIDLISDGMNNGSSKYGTAIKFLSSDGQFTTENPKFLAAIVPRATETYSADTDGGMALDFAVTDDNPGTSNLPSVAMTVDHTGNVGIGTTSPDAKLEIQQTDGAVHGLKVYRNDSSTSTPLVYLHDDSQYNDNPTLHVRNDRVDQYRYAAVFEGMVGIGTTTPDQQLHVEGSILADAYNFATTTLASNYTDGETSLVLTDASQFPLKGSGTINGVAFTWTSVSTNTLTVPDLDASYTAGVTVVADTGLFFRDGFENVAQPSVTIYDKDDSGASRDDLSINANAGIRFRLGNESQMQLTTDQLSLTTGNQASAAIFGFRDRTDMGIKSNAAYSVGVLAPDNVFIQTDSNNNGSTNYIDFGHGSNLVGSATSMMRIVMGGATGPGKIGIGTTDPDQLLHVVGDSNDDTVALFSTAGGTGGSTQGTVHIGLSHFSTDANPSVRIGAEENGVGSYQAAMTFGTRSATSDAAPTERMRLTHNGQLLLTNGTSAAVASGSVGIVEDGDTVEIRNQHGIINIGSTNTSYMHITTDRSRFYFDESLVVNDGMVSSYDEDLQLKRAQSDDEKIVVGDNSMTFTSAGNDVVTVDGTNTRVGIGTTSPQQTLDVDGNLFLGKSGESTALTGSPQIFVQGDTAVATFKADNASSGDQIAGIRVFGDSYRSIGMVIGDYDNSDGSVTEDWIFGRQYASGSKAGIFAAPENGGDEYITVNSDSQKAVKIAGDDDDIDFIIHGSSGEYFRAEASTGRVGIGTTSPSVPLEVDGTIKADKLNLVDGTSAITIQSSNPLREKKIYATTSGDGSPFDEMVFHSEGSTGGWSGQHTFTVSKSEDDDPDVFAPYTAFRIRDSGNGTSSEVLVSHKLGVGILDPVPMLHIYGNNSTTNQTTSGAASITIEQDGAGDAALNFLLTATRRWIAGIDNSNSDKFKISTGGTDLQTGTKLTVDTGGNLTMAGNVNGVDGNFTGTLSVSTTAQINGSHSFVRATAITQNGDAIDGTNITKCFAAANTYAFSNSYDLLGNLASGGEVELFRFNVTSNSYRKFQAGKMYVRVQDVPSNGFFQQTVTFGYSGTDVLSSTTDRIDSTMGGNNANWTDEKATIVVEKVSDYICVKFKNDTGSQINAGAPNGWHTSLSCELFEMDAIVS